MDKTEVYRIWAPADAVWSPWVKPILFAWTESEPSAPPGASDVVSDDFRYLPEATDRPIVIVDLPGTLSLRCGLELATRGFRPVPLYNCIPGPTPLGYVSPTLGEVGVVVDVRPIISLIWHNSAWLENLNLPVDAPPAFLLDSQRFSFSIFDSPRPLFSIRYFENRWLIFPEDFPSPAFFQERSLHRVIIIQSRRTARLDLRQVLIDWQGKGLALEFLRFPAREPASVCVVKKLSFLDRFYFDVRRDSLWGDSKNGFGALRFRSSG
jgi:hypothetical protein